jgi:acetyl esterase/lipase
VVADRLVPEDPLPERRTVWDRPGVSLTDVVYETLPGYRPLHLDLYQPSDRARPLPLVLFLHGGGWAYANPRAGAAFRNFPMVLATLADRGYVVASVEYRFLKEAPYPAQREDIQAAIRFLRANAARLHIDPGRVGLWGMSAGAYLAGMEALNCVDGACVQGWVGWFGVYEIPSTEPLDEDGRELFGCAAEGCSAEKLASVSPIRFADERDPPTLLVHGAADPVPVSNSQRLVDRLRAVGAKADLEVIPGVSHGMVGASEAVTKAALRQALTSTFGFFDRVLKAPAKTPSAAP